MSIGNKRDDPDEWLRARVEFLLKGRPHKILESCFAKEGKTGHSAVSRFLKPGHRNNPKLDKIDCIAAQLGMSLPELFGAPPPGGYEREDLLWGLQKILTGKNETAIALVEMAITGALERISELPRPAAMNGSKR